MLFSGWNTTWLTFYSNLSPIYRLSFVLFIERVVPGIGSLETTSSSPSFDRCCGRDSNWISRGYKSDELLTEHQAGVAATL
jgi:hypothetical protein